MSCGPGAGFRYGLRLGWRAIGLLALAWALPVAWSLEPGVATAANYRPDRVIVRHAPAVSGRAVAELHQRLGGRVLRAFGRTQVVGLRAGQTVEQALEAYRGHHDIESVEPDFLLQALATPDDFHYRNGDQWNLHNTGIYGGTVGADIDAERAWDQRTGAPELIVAVIDSGVRYTHEDLAPNMWVNPGESGLDPLGRDRRTNGVDDDANGYVDDVHGINVLNGSGNPFDDWGHGTHVAGIVGAAGNNGVGVAGVAWRVKIMACKFIDAAANYSVSDAIACLDYARRHGARIVTASWGGYAFHSPALQDAIGQLRAAGIIVAAAAGNDNNNNDLLPLYPASYDFDNIIAVAATNRVDDRAGYSNFGATTVDLGAPGSPVFSAWAGHDRDYRYHEGTSMAAPHVAGACALLWAQFPADTYQQLIQRILSSVDPLPALTGRTRSSGRLNLASALAGGGPPPPPPPPVVLTPPGNLTATASSPNQVDLRWTDNTTTESGFEIERSTDNVGYVNAGTVGADVTVFAVGGLNAATTYYFRVRAVQGAAASGYSNTASATTPAAPPPPPPPSGGGSWAGVDVGAVAAAGASSGSGTSFTVSGSGADIWDRNDEFRYHYQTWSGDGSFVVQITGMTNTDSWAKAGIMLRESLAPNARHILLAANPASAAALCWRSTTGGTTDFRYGGYSIPRIWLKLVRTGGTIQAYQSGDGLNWGAIGGPVSVSLPATILAGLAVTSHRDGMLCTATFEQVTFPGGSAPPGVSVNPPSGLAATAMSSSQIDLTWADNSGNETGFELERSADNVSFARLATLAANAVSYSDAGLAARTTHYYRIRAIGDGAASSFSNTTSATTASPPGSSNVWSHADIGAVGLPGSDDAAGTTITVRGSGSDIWDRTDAFRFLYRNLTGDCVVEAQVTSLTNTHGWAKAGVMIRESLEPGARNAYVFLSPSSGARAQLRATTGGTTTTTSGPWGPVAPYWLRLARTGNVIVATGSNDGLTWTTIASYTVAFNAEVLVGFAVTSHDNTKLNTATFEEPFIQ